MYVLMLIITIISNLVFLIIGLKVGKNEPIEIPKVELPIRKDDEEESEADILMNNINNYPYNQKEV